MKLSRLVIVPVLVTATSFIGCKQPANTPTVVETPSRQPRNSRPQTPVTSAPPASTQAVTNPPQAPAEDPRRQEFHQREETISSQIRLNEIQQGTLKAEIQKAGYDIETFNYSGRSVRENPYYDIKIKKTQELADVLKQRLALDDQLKALYEQYPEFSR